LPILYSIETWPVNVDHEIALYRTEMNMSMMHGFTLKEKKEKCRAVNIVTVNCAFNILILYMDSTYSSLSIL